MDKNFTTVKVNVTLDEMIEIDKNLNLSARLNIAKLEHKDLTAEDIIKEHLIGKENLRFNKIDEKLKEYDKKIEECLNIAKSYVNKDLYNITKEQSKKISEMIETEKKDKFVLPIPICEKWDPKEKIILNKDDEIIDCFVYPESITEDGTLKGQQSIRMDKFIGLEIIHELPTYVNERSQRKEAFMLVFNYYDKPKDSAKHIVKFNIYEINTDIQRDKIQEIIFELQNSIYNRFQHNLIYIKSNMTNGKKSYSLDYSLQIVKDCVYDIDKFEKNENITLWGGERINLSLTKKNTKQIHNKLYDKWINY